STRTSCIDEALIHGMSPFQYATLSFEGVPPDENDPSWPSVTRPHGPSSRNSGNRSRGTNSGCASFLFILRGRSLLVGAQSGDWAAAGAFLEEGNQVIHEGE